MSAVDDAARLCHATVRRLPGRAAVPRQVGLATGSPAAGTPWVEDVPFPADSPEAAAWRERELSRPVDPSTGPGRRVVLLRYADGAADLVTVTHRAGSRGGGAHAFPLTAATLSDGPDHRRDSVAGDGDPVAGRGDHLAELVAALRRIDEVGEPDWGLGDRHAGDAVGRHEFVIADAGATELTVLAALGLVLGRYTGQTTVTVGTADPRRSVALAVGPGSAVDAHLDAVRRAAAATIPLSGATAGDMPLVGLTVTRATVAGAAMNPGIPEIQEFTAPTTRASTSAAAVLAGVVATGAGGGAAAGGAAAGGAAAGGTGGNVTVRPFLAPVQPLSIHLAGAGGPILHGTCWYRLRYFDPRIVEQFARHLATAHRALLEAAPGTAVGDVPILDGPERRRIAGLGGVGRRAPEPEHELIHRAVAAQAARTPHAVAVSCAGRALTYGELDARANRAAHVLRAAGARPGTRIGVCLDRSLDLVVALLAVLKAGAAYVPMDPSYPAERLAFTAEDAGLTAVVAAEATVPGLTGVPVLPVTALTGEAVTADRPGSALSGDAVTGERQEPAPPDDGAPVSAPPVRAPSDGGPPEDGNPEHAYVIYTSGSTGTPKGVVVPHRNVASLLAATRGEFGLGERDVWTQFHSAAFDFSVWEIWGCLMTGGRLVLVPYWVSRSPEDFAALLDSEAVTVLSQTPSAFAQLQEVDRRRRLPDPVRLVIFGGEPLDTGPLLSWFDRHPESRCRLVNMYGITETTVHVTAQTVTRAEALGGSRSVGRPLPGWHVAVLDEGGRPLPPGVAGEIHVGGAGVAAGYLDRPELTAQRFRTDPETGGRWYRSGDRGRLLPDGRLEHLGRLDSQVQLRGFRIELDEVRARLLTAPGVAAAAVTLRQRDGDAATAALAAYVVLGGGPGRSTEEVRRHLARFLPEHMVPATVTALPALPLTPNGKVDTARLPQPLPPASDRGEVVSHQSSRDDVTSSPERLVLDAWGSVFGFRVRPDDDFFALGGNSLLAVRLSAALHAAGLPRISVRQLYGHRTAAKVTALLAEVQPA